MENKEAILIQTKRSLIVVDGINSIMDGCRLGQFVEKVDSSDSG